MSEETAIARIRGLERTLEEAENEIADLRRLVNSLRARLRDDHAGRPGAPESGSARDGTAGRAVVPGDGCPHVDAPERRR